MPAMASQAGGGGLPSTRRYRSERHSTTAWRMSTATPWDWPLRSFQIFAAASPAAATLVCAAAATRNDDGNCGSSPVSVTVFSVAGSPRAEVQISARISFGVFLGLCISVTLPYPSSLCRFLFDDGTKGVAMAALDPLTAGAVLLATA